MITDTYITFLRVRHKQLEEAIREEARRPLPDSLQVQLMKRQRLRIKDKLQRIEAIGEPTSFATP